MMSSLGTTPYTSRIDHRTVLKNLQIESNNTLKENTNADITIDTSKTTTTTKKPNTKLSINYPCSSTRSYILHRSNIATTLAPKTKIPFPLATLCSNHKSGNFKRSVSLRMRGTKSNLPLIMEPTINETPTINAATMHGEKCAGITKNTHETTNTTANVAGGLQVSTRQKLALISQTDANVAEPTLIKRSQSLRRNFKVSTTINNRNYNKTDSSKDKLCGATTNIKSLSSHDVHQTNDQGDGPKTATTTLTGVEKQTSTDADNVKDFSNMVSFFQLNPKNLINN